MSLKETLRSGEKPVYTFKTKTEQIAFAAIFTLEKCSIKKPVPIRKNFAIFTRNTCNEVSLK